MKIFKILVPTIIAFFVTGLIANEFYTFSLNFGSLWININMLYSCFTGIFLSYIIINSKFLLLRILHVFFLILFTIILILSLIDSIYNYLSNTLLIFGLILLVTLIFLKKYEGSKKKNKSIADV